jgi:hypothetical protein
VKVAYAQYLGSPRFSVCPAADGDLCKLGNVPTGQADELQVGVKVQAKAALGEQVQLTAKASAKGAKSFDGSATDMVVASRAPSTTIPPTTTVTLPPTSLPPISGTGGSSGDPSSLFPTVGPAPSSSPPAGAGSLGLPQVKPKKTVHAADVAATVPLDPRLIGGQLAGLAVLAGAVVIAIARLSLRTPKPADDKSGQRPPQ